MKKILRVFSKSQNSCCAKVKEPLLNSRHETKPVEEIKKEPKSPVEDLVSILNSRIDNPRGSIHLTEEELNYLTRLVKENPVFFQDIHVNIENIIKDGILNIHNIPEIVLLLTNIFQVHFIENCIQEFGMTNIIHFIIDAILDSNLFHIPEVEVEIIKRVVSISLILLKTDVNMEKEIICCQGLFGFLANKKK